MKYKKMSDKEFKKYFSRYPEKTEREKYKDETLSNRINRIKHENENLIPENDTDYYCGVCGNKGLSHPRSSYCFICGLDAWISVYGEEL